MVRRFPIARKRVETLVRGLCLVDLTLVLPLAVAAVSEVVEWQLWLLVQLVVKMLVVPRAFLRTVVDGMHVVLS